MQWGQAEVPIFKHNVIELPKSYKMKKGCSKLKLYMGPQNGQVALYSFDLCNVYHFLLSHTQTLRELAELLIGRLSVWSADRDSTQATLLFLDHCVECVNTLVSDNTPTSLLTKVSPYISY